MSRKRGKKQKAVVEAIPDDILAEGSGPVGGAAADPITTAEDIVTTDDVATTEDVITADDVVATAPADDEAADPDAELAAADLEARLATKDAKSGPAHDSDIVTAAELAEAMEAATGEGAELEGAELDSVDAELDSVDAELDSVDAELDAPGAELAGEGGEGDEDDADGAIVFPTSAATMDAVQLKHLVEALIFASDRPLTVQRLRQLTRVGDVRRLEQALVQIAEDYKERGLILQQVSGGYQFRTRTQFSAWVQQLIAGRPVRLSRAQLETLAIIAYRQPITRPEIDDIRGVDSSATLKLLIDRMLIRVLGKREEVGRPMLYGTTKEFLDFFSLGDLRELPTLREYSELTAESRKVMSDRLGLPPDGNDSGGTSGSGGGGPDGGGSDGGGSDGGGSGGGDSSGGDGSGGGPIPGFGDDGAMPDDGGSPAHAMTDDVDDAMATFLSAADAVDRSDAAAVAEPDVEEVEMIDVDLDASESEAVEPVAVETGAVEASAVETAAVEAGAVETDAVDASALETEALETEAVETEALETEALETEALETAAFEAVALESDTGAPEEHLAEEPVVAAAEESPWDTEVILAAGDATTRTISLPDSDLDPDSVADPESAPDIEAISASESALEAASEVEPEPALEPDPESEPETISLTDSQTVSEVGLDAEPGDSEAVTAAGEESMSDADALGLEGGRVEDNDGWPAGSQRITVADQTPIPVIAPSDHRPVERPVMDSNVIGAGAPDDNLGEAAPAARHGEPAAE